jgi:DNA-binding LacI/PurR family transcriptional regulator
MTAILPSNRRGRRPGPAMRAVAEGAGVSVATVSRVLNNHPAISEATRRRVLAECQKLGYSLHTRRTRPHRIGLVTSVGADEYIAKLLYGVAATVHDHGGALDLLVLDGTDRATAQSPALHDFLATNLEGALLVLPHETSDDLERLRRQTCPFVVVHARAPLVAGIPEVGAADIEGARSAVEHLLRLGHERIGVVTGPPWPETADRLAGYHAALAAAGLPIRPELVVQGDYLVESGYRGGRQLLAGPQRPTAVFALNDIMAAGVMQAARAMALSVPSDLSVVGFDDRECAALLSPPLTTVRLPATEIGRVGAELLYRLLSSHPVEAAHVHVSTSLVVRASTAAPPRPPAPPTGLSLS